jgi:hypothetical protein
MAGGYEVTVSATFARRPKFVGNDPCLLVFDVGTPAPVVTSSPSANNRYDARLSTSVT